jgi:hypothetical protein
MSAAEDPDETERERLNRQLEQLLQELRVAMPGVQVLFAFLLAVPFQQRFAQVTEFQRDVYFVTLLAAAAASALFIAPTAFHRLRFEDGDKAFLVAAGSRMTVGGLFFLAVAMTGAVLLVSDVLFDGTVVTITVAVAGLLYAGLWFGPGMARDVRGKGRR